MTEKPFLVSITNAGRTLNGGSLAGVALRKTQLNGREVVMAAIPAELVEYEIDLVDEMAPALRGAREPLDGEVHTEPEEAPVAAKVVAPREPQEPRNPYLGKHVEALGLHARATNVLLDNRMSTVRRVVKRTPSELKAIPGISGQTVLQIRHKLAEWDLTLDGDEQPRSLDIEPEPEPLPEPSKPGRRPFPALEDLTLLGICTTQRRLSILEDGGVRTVEELVKFSADELLNLLEGLSIRDVELMEHRLAHYDMRLA